MQPYRSKHPHPQRLAPDPGLCANCPISLAFSPDDTSLSARVHLAFNQFTCNTVNLNRTRLSSGNKHHCSRTLPCVERNKTPEVACNASRERSAQPQQPSPPVSTSRRTFTALALTTLAAAVAPLSPGLAAGPPTRTLFDEERERSEQAARDARVAKTLALRAGFDAVERATVQLDDLQAFVEKEDWGNVRQFTRLFNNSVEREGMEKIANKLAGKVERKAALATCKQVTDALIRVDKCAMGKDKHCAIASLQQVRDAVRGFREFMPEMPS